MDRGDEEDVVPIADGGMLGLLGAMEAEMRVAGFKEPAESLDVSRAGWWDG